MNQGTKQRVVGTVVLLSLALIFLPLLFDGEGSYQPTIRSRIPEAPVVDIMPEPQPQRPAIEADRLPPQASATTPAADIQLDDTGPEPTDITVVEETVPEQSEYIPPALNELSLPQGWSVRLGVFSNPENASNLKQQLLDAGYRAYTRELPGRENSVTGVFVGPHIERLDANRLRSQLQDEFELEAMVVPFEVDSIQ